MAQDVYDSWTDGGYSWQCPAGVTSVQIECWGAGGCGGRETTYSASHGGGGGGAYSKKYTYSVTPSSYYTVYVGKGALDTSPTNPDGEDSYFVSTAVCMAAGGDSALNNSNIAGMGGQAAASVGDVKYSGGDGYQYGYYEWTVGGGGGSSAGTSANGNDASGQSGASAPSGGGAGGNGGPYVSQTNGSPGYSPGGGGGGAGANPSGGANYGGHGADGKVILTYTTATIPTVSTTYISAGNIDMNHAHGGGNVTSDGGASVTARGNVWDKTDTTPDYPSDAYSSDGSGTGAFSSTLTPLNMGRLYYYRAYAVNSQGTGYGSVYSLTTDVPEPDPLEADEAELLIPTVAVTSVIPVTIELTNALTATGGIYGVDVAIGLPKPQLTLSLPNVTDIRVSWSGSIYGTAYYINDNYDDCMAITGYTLTFENLQPGDNDGMSTHIGMRFYNVAIPKDATIISARLRFVCDVSYSNNDCNLVVKGENNATPATFSTLGDFEGRSRTTAYQNWDAVEGWTADEVYYSPDFAPVVSEITSLAGWVSGNYMVIFVENNSSDYYCMRQASGYADAPGLAPRLEVEWV